MRGCHERVCYERVCHERVCHERVWHEPPCKLPGVGDAPDVHVNERVCHVNERVCGVMRGCVSHVPGVGDAPDVHVNPETVAEYGDLVDDGLQHCGAYSPHPHHSDREVKGGQPEGSVHCSKGSGGIPSIHHRRDVALITT